VTTENKDFKVKNGLQVADGATFGAAISVGEPTLDEHAATKEYVDNIASTPGPTGPAGDPAEFYIGETPPLDPSPGQIWIKSTDATQYTYIDDFWVEISGPAGPIGANWSTVTGTVSYPYSGSNNYIDISVALTSGANPPLIVGDYTQLIDNYGTVAVVLVATTTVTNEVVTNFTGTVVLETPGPYGSYTPGGGGGGGGSDSRLKNDILPLEVSWTTN
jgi:hypothetical protein